MEKFEPLVRERCVICGWPHLFNTALVPSVPIYMGVTDVPETGIKADLEFVICDRCKSVQLEKLAPPEVLYPANHNLDVVGGIWQAHHQEFSQFILKHTERLNSVLEIGSPTDRLARSCPHKSWTIVEKNPTQSEILPTVNFIEAWFTSDLKLEPADTVVLSHVFEHFFNPVRELKALKNLLKPTGHIFISIPDAAEIAKARLLPPAGIHFEHTFYLDLEVLRFIAARCGLQVMNVEKFRSHSLFIDLQVTRNTIRPFLPPAFIQANANAEQALLETLTLYDEVIIRANHIIEDHKIFVFGAHFFTQMLIAMGLIEEGIEAILDNSPSKNGKYLNGSFLEVELPEVISGLNNPQVLCYAGVYTEEIKNQLREINPEVVFI